MSKINLNWGMNIIAGILILTIAFGKSAEGQNLNGEDDPFECNGIANKNIPLEEKFATIRRNLQHYEKNTAWEKYGICLYERNLIYYNEQDYPNFISHSKKDFEFLKEKGVSKTDFAFVYSLILLSISHELRGDYKRAIELQKESIKYSKNPIAKWNGYDGLGYIYQNIHDFDAAIQSYNYALAILNETDTPNPFDIGTLIRQKAYCMKEKGDFENAHKLFHESLGFIQKATSHHFYHQTLWYIYQDLSDLHLKMGNTERALYYSGQAINVLMETDDIYDSYKTYLNHGEVWLKKKDFEKAIDSFDKAYSMARNQFSGFEAHPSYAICLMKKAEAELGGRNYAEALQLVQEALSKIAVNFESADIDKNPKPADYIIKKDGLNILALKAKILSQLFHEENEIEFLENAHQTNLLASQLIRVVRQEYIAVGSKHTLAASVLPIYENAIDIALKLYQSKNETGFLEDAYSFAEANKATLLYESLKNREAKGIAGIPDSLLKRENELNLEHNFYVQEIKKEKQKGAAISHEKIKQWEKIAFELEINLESLVKNMETNYPAYLEEKRKTAPASVTTTRQLFPDENTAMVEYMIGKEKGYVFVLTKNELQVFELNNLEKLTDQIGELRQMVSAPPRSDFFSVDYNNFTELSSHIFRQLLNDGINTLPNNIDRLIIVPDDVLCFLPFEVLLMKKTKSENADYSIKKLDYLFEKFSISYQYSASLMNSVNKDFAEPDDLSPFLGLAPTFGSATTAQRNCSPDMLYSLQCNQEEIKAINQLWGGEALLAGDAKLENFLSGASRNRILHLATHACVNEDDVALSAIYFTDSSLTQLDLNNLHLNSDMTVLSACNTGTGKLLRGEGVMSLTRGFMLAGSRSVITSLWSVDDCATSNIMVGFYAHLKKGMAKDDALRQAKLDYLASADRNNRHPYYWAAFVQFGNVEAFPSSQFPVWWAIAMVITLLGIFMFFRKKRSE